MSDQREENRHPPGRHEREHPELRAEAKHRPEEAPRKPSPIEHREWRGAGVCGDRHTD